MSLPIGSIVWSVDPVIAYRSGMQIPATIYVHNGTAGIQTYSLQVIAESSTTTSVVSDIQVAGADTFSVNPSDTATVFGMVSAPFDNGTLTLQLTDETAHNIIDTIKSELITPNQSSVTLIGGNINNGSSSSVSGVLPAIIEFMLIMMIMKMMMGMFSSSKVTKVKV